MSKAGSYCILIPLIFNHLFWMVLTVVPLINGAQQLAGDAISVQGELGLYE